jgi:amino acid adenylation domain-containing protein/FkbM family methyltransferase
LRSLEHGGVLSDAADSMNLVALARDRARRHPAATAYLFLANGEDEQDALTFGELDRKARAIAAQLQALAAPGQRAVLLYPAGLAYIEAFLGCLYAGIVAVPAHLPSRRQGARLRAVLADADPALILATAELADKYRADWADEGIAAGLCWLSTDQTEAALAERWLPPSLTSDSLAFLQYTSGSTGNPKGVMVSHGNLVANQEAIRRAFGHTEQSTVVGWLPFHHDMGLIGNLLQPLYVGSTAVLMPPLAFLEKPVRWLRAISAYGATTSGGPNFAYELCARKVAEAEKRGLDLSGWTLAFNGSEPVRAATLERFCQAFAPCGFRRDSLFPCYGLAEATLFVTGAHWAPLPNPSEASPVPCGHAWTAHHVRVVDPVTCQPCPPGQVGEVWVAGPSVAQGYWNQPEESARLFRASLEGATPDTAPATGFLRTGDLGYLGAEGLCVTGRMKDLVIIRGRNVHPEDVEHALTSQIGALQAGGCAAFSTTRDDEEQLVVVAEVTRETRRRADLSPLLAELQAVLTETLELAAAELVLVPPGAVPKTTSGKVRRGACQRLWLQGELPALARTGLVPTVPPAADNTATDGAPDTLFREALALLSPEQRTPLIAAFLRRQIAKLSRTSPQQLTDAAPWRALGLDSLRTVELKHALADRLGIDAPLSLLLADGTLGEVAAHLAGLAGTSAPESGPVQTPPTGPADFALSATQRAIWALQQREPHSPVYNLQLALRIEGGLDAAALERAFRALVARHEMLRTVYRLKDEGLVRAIVLPADAPQACEWNLLEATAASAADLRRDIEQRALAPFDLAHGPVVRATLYRHEPDSHSLLFGVHHIAVDLWAVLRLLEELRALYRADGRTGMAPAVHYSDFVRWQAAYLESGRGAADWEYWRSRLSGGLPTLALPTDFARPAVPNYRGGSCGLRVTAALADPLRALAVRHGVTVFTVLFAAYKALLHRYGQQTDLIVGTASSGRPAGRFASLIGNCVNPLPVRSTPSARTPFADYLRQVGASLRDALDHQDFPFSALVERLQPERDADRWPIFQTLFVFRTEPSGAAANLASLTLGEPGTQVDWDGWRLEPIGLGERGETFDLTLTMADHGGGFLASFHYRRDLFSPDTVARLAGHFQTLLEGIAAAPATCLGELPLLTEAERRQLLDWGGAAVQAEADASQGLLLHRLFERQAARQPEAEALVFAEHGLSYGALDEQAEQLARRLRAHGVGPEVRVGLCVERSPAMLAGILGILKAGGAYVPLDPTYPTERLDYMLTDSRARLVLTHSALLDKLPPAGIATLCLDQLGDPAPASAAPLAELHPGCAAYVIYTSGSTGRPKGVVVSHANAVQSTAERFRYYPDPVRRFLLLSSFAFDSSVAGLFWTLGQGGCLVLPPEGAQKDPALLGGLIARQRVSHLLCLPSLHSLLLEQAGRLDSLRAVIVAGEACPRDTVTRHLARCPQARLYNEYGPTEATVWSSVHEITAHDLETERSISIGRPLAHTRLYLLDAQLEPVPVGVPGEIHLGGAGVARGYLDKPALTAERFLPDPFGPPGGRLYRTGDLARWRADGTLEFLGRMDQQVKLRGHRIEPGETDYLYQTIFAERDYLRHGVSLGEAPCVVDVGANIGMFTLFVNHLRPKAKVYACEPIPALFERLRLNAKLYGENTTAIPCGLSNRDAEVTFTFYPKSSLMSGRYADRDAERHVVKSYLRNREGHDFSDQSAQLDGLVDGRLDGQTLACPVRTLSGIIREYGIAHIDLLKIDAERSELDVLEGIAPDDWARIDQIVLEVEDSQGRLGQIRGLLESQGYAVALEQERLLRGTAIHNLYARRPGLPEPAPVPAPAPAPTPSYPAPLSNEALRQFLKARLPEPMVPSACVVLDRLPLTPNGKLDRKALPAPDLGQALTALYQAPAAAFEEQLAAIWREVLGVERVGVRDNFFDLGGHSLSAIQVIVRIQDAFGVELSVAELFDAPTIAGLSAILAARPPADADDAELESMLYALQQLPEDEAQRLLQDLQV